MVKAERIADGQHLSADLECLRRAQLHRPQTVLPFPATPLTSEPDTPDSSRLAWDSTIRRHGQRIAPKFCYAAQEKDQQLRCGHNKHVGSSRTQKGFEKGRVAREGHTTAKASPA